jgi:hypothetical protein
MASVCGVGVVGVLAVLRIGWIGRHVMYESAAGVKRIFPVFAAIGGNNSPCAWHDASG